SVTHPLDIIFSFCQHTTLLNITLLPYTTLFRSRKINGHSSKTGPTPRHVILNRYGHGGNNGLMLNPPQWCLKILRSSTLIFATIDRKSTRLNSSHVSISYAVFCLKNKTKIIDSQ